MKENSWTWGHLERRAPVRSQRRALTEALRVSKHEQDQVSKYHEQLAPSPVANCRLLTSLAENCGILQAKFARGSLKFYLPNLRRALFD